MSAIAFDRSNDPLATYSSQTLKLPLLASTSFALRRKLTVKSLFLVAAFVLSGTLFASDALAQKGFSKVVTDPTRWATVEYANQQECSGTPEDCALKMLGAMNISVGDDPAFSVYRLGETEDKNVTVVFVSHLVEDDDSVLGELYRLELSQAGVADESFSLSGVGKMYQCMEGRVGWRKTECP